MNKFLTLLLLLPTQLAFAQEGSDAALYRWGAATNNIQVGLRSSLGPPYVVSVALRVADATITTNYVPTPRTYTSRYKPFSIALRDPQGNTIPLTAEGREFTQPSKPVTLSYWNSRGYELLAFFGQTPYDIGSFRISKCFRWQRAGLYELEVRVTVLRSTGLDTQFAPIPLPPAKLKLQLPSPN